MDEGKPPDLPPTRSRRDDYRMARIGAMSGLTALVCILGIQDSLSVDYTLDGGTLSLLLVAIFGLAGLEVRDLIQGGKD